VPPLMQRHGQGTRGAGRTAHRCRRAAGARQGNGTAAAGSQRMRGNRKGSGGQGESSVDWGAQEDWRSRQGLVFWAVLGLWAMLG